MQGEPCRLTVQGSDRLTAGQTYWITARTRDEVPVFGDFQAARTLIRVLQEETSRGGHRSLAYVVLPSLVHWLVQPGRLALPLLAGRIKARTALRLGRPIWQAGLHGQILGPRDQPVALARYLLTGPLRAGLASRLGLYPHWDAAWLPGPSALPGSGQARLDGPS